MVMKHFNVRGGFLFQIFINAHNAVAPTEAVLVMCKYIDT